MLVLRGKLWGLVRVVGERKNWKGGKGKGRQGEEEEGLGDARQS